MEGMGLSFVGQGASERLPQCDEYSTPRYTGSELGIRN